MRVNTSLIYAQTSETDQVVYDSRAALFDSDLVEKNYLSGTIGFVTGAGDPDQGNAYILCRESTFVANGLTIFDALNGGRWFLLGAVNPAPGSIVLFSAGTQPQEGGGVEVYGPNAQGALAVASGLSFVAPRDGTLMDLRFRMESANGGVNTLAAPIPCAVYLNGGGPTALTVNVPAGDAEANVADTTHEVAVVAGDLVQLTVDFSNADGDLENFSISVVLA